MLIYNLGAMPDQFSDSCSDLLEGQYDCVDRVVLNAYFPLAQKPGGFRTWWRQMSGSDEHLDDTHLMRLAGRFGRRVRAFAKARNLPVVFCATGTRKDEVAQEYRAQHPGVRGLFLILVGRAPAPVWQVKRNAQGTITELAHPKARPYVNHFYFHILDPDWGHLVIKMCAHPPFNTQVLLNGHEYVASQASQKGIAFTQQQNCFTQASSLADLGPVAETLSEERTIGRLRRVCERWIYLCLCLALDSEDQHRSGFRYEYSVYQMEYSRNLLFWAGGVMNELFQAVIDRNRAALDLDRVKTLFGSKKRPCRRKRQSSPNRWGVLVEKPAYDLTVFKVHFGKLTLKIYTKGERVLRIEAIAHNSRALPCGRSLPNFAVIVRLLRGMVNRFLNALQSLDSRFIGDHLLERLPQPSHVGKTRVGGIDFNRLRIRRVTEALLALAPSPQGFTASQVASQVQARSGRGESAYGPRRAAYDLKKFRAKNLVRKIERTRRYEIVPQGLRALAALVVLRDKVIKPLLAADCHLRRGPKPKNQTVLDQHYHLLRTDMLGLFSALRIAA
jgi:hypothetical protein